MNLKNNPELIPLIDWWEKEGKSTVIWLLVAALCVGGWYGWKNHRLAKRAAAAETAANAYTVQQLEDAVSRFSGDKAAGVMRLRRAKAYYDEARYDEALAAYDELVKEPPAGFADVCAVGRAQSLEALKRYDEAAKEFDAFVAANPKSYLKLTAQLGSVRAVAQGGDKAKALKTLETLKAEVKDDPVATARIENAEDLVKRFNPTITSADGATTK